MVTGVLLWPLLALGGLASAADVNGITPASFGRSLEPRQGVVTGCFCSEFNAYYPGDPSARKRAEPSPYTVFYGEATNNPEGWCFNSSALNPWGISRVEVAIQQNLTTPYVNGPRANLICDHNGTPALSQECTDYWLNVLTEEGPRRVIGEGIRQSCAPAPTCVCHNVAYYMPNPGGGNDRRKRQDPPPIFLNPANGAGWCVLEGFLDGDRNASIQDGILQNTISTYFDGVAGNQACIDQGIAAQSPECVTFLANYITQMIPGMVPYGWTCQATTTPPAPTSCFCADVYYDYWESMPTKRQSRTPLFNGVLSTNPDGWCFIDGSLRPEHIARVTEAVLSNTVTAYANGPLLNSYCDPQQTNTCVDSWVSYLNGIASDMIQQSGSACEWGTDAQPLSCQCAITCQSPLQPCDLVCIDPETTICASSTPQQRRGMFGRALPTTCPRGTSMCRVNSGGFECIDTSSTLDSCGGCPGRGVDCTAIDGVYGVRCVDGKCRVSSCAPGYTLYLGVCVARK